VSHIATLVQTLAEGAPAVRLAGVGKLAIAVTPREAAR
jgi:hypothetical protein